MSQRLVLKVLGAELFDINDVGNQLDGIPVSVISKMTSFEVGIRKSLSESKHLESLLSSVTARELNVYYHQLLQQMNDIYDEYTSLYGKPVISYILKQPRNMKCIDRFQSLYHEITGLNQQVGRIHSQSDIQTYIDKFSSVYNDWLDTVQADSLTCRRMIV